MSLHEFRKAKAVYLPVTCWRCDAPMKIKTIIPAMTSPPLDEVVYRCSACKIERTRIVLRNGKGSSEGPQLAAPLVCDAPPPVARGINLLASPTRDLRDY